MKSKSDLILNPLSIEIPKKPANKSASEHRKITKPIMERRRRARINNSLNKLKALILEALNKDPSRHSKLEKADILEMTVNYLQGIQAKPIQNPSTRNNSPVDPIGKFRDGFNECATEITRYMSSVNDIDTEMKQRVTNYLSSRVTMINTALNNPFYIQSPISPTTAMTSANVKQSPSPLLLSDNNNNNIRVQVPLKNDLNNNLTDSKSSTTSASQMFTFTFTAPPSTHHHHHHHSQLPYSNGLHSPITPTTPNTRYSNSIDLSLNMKSWKQEHLDDSRSVGSLSPGLSSVRSLSPVNETSDLHTQHSSSTSNSSCWRPW